MATLHLPKNQPVEHKAKKTKREVDRELDEALKESFPTSDPVAITTPGGPVEPGENPKDKKSGQKLPGGKPDGTRDT
jgi:hypothetical protein